MLIFELNEGKKKLTSEELATLQTNSKKKIVLMDVHTEKPNDIGIIIKTFNNKTLHEIYLYKLYKEKEKMLWDLNSNRYILFEEIMLDSSVGLSFSIDCKPEIKFTVDIVIELC
jgi:hypothetical protein